MNRENAHRAIVLTALAILVLLYISSGTPQSTTPAPSAAQQKEVAELRKQLAGLQEKVNWLEERFTEPQRQKPSQF
jgi:TolA-binding protein